MANPEDTAITDHITGAERLRRAGASDRPAGTEAIGGSQETAADEDSRASSPPPASAPTASR